MTIPNKPLGKNSVPSTEVLFNDRRYYKSFILEYIRSLHGTVPFGDLLSNNRLFGLINTSNSIVTADPDYLVSIPSANNQPQKVQDFVYDAFNDFRNFFKDAAYLGKINKSSPFYDPKVYKSYESPDTEAITATTLYGYDFKKKIISDNKLNSSITDHKQFTKHFIPFLKSVIKDGLSVTKSGLVISTNFSSFCSGLIIDIANDKVDDDKIKYDKYLSTSDFRVYKEACVRYGFMIDKNVPWRMIADVNSPSMIKSTGTHLGYMLRKNITTLDDLFINRFNLVILEEIQFLKKMFYDSYIYFLKENMLYEQSYSTICSSNSSKQDLKTREKVTEQKYYEDFPDTFWLRLFVYFRNYEVKRNLQQQEFENIVREANNFIKYGYNNKALLYVETKFIDFTIPRRSDIYYDIIF